MVVQPFGPRGLSPQIKQTISEDLRSFSSWWSLHESAQLIELTMMTYQWSHFTFIHTVRSTYLLSNALISRGFHLILQRKINKKKSHDSLQLLILFLELVYARNEVSRKVSLALFRVWKSYWSNLLWSQQTICEYKNQCGFCISQSLLLFILFESFKKRRGENEQLQIVLSAHKNFRYIPQCISAALILCLDKIESWTKRRHKSIQLGLQNQFDSDSSLNLESH